MVRLHWPSVWAKMSVALQRDYAFLLALAILDNKTQIEAILLMDGGKETLPFYQDYIWIKFSPPVVCTINV